MAGREGEREREVFEGPDSVVVLGAGVEGRV